MDAVLSLPMSHVPSLAAELRAYKLCGAANNIQINKYINKYAAIQYLLLPNRCCRYKYFQEPGETKVTQTKL